MYTVIQSGLGDLLSEGETDREDYYPLSKADFGELGAGGLLCYVWYGMLYNNMLVYDMFIIFCYVV